MLYPRCPNALNLTTFYTNPPKSGSIKAAPTYFLQQLTGKIKFKSIQQNMIICLSHTRKKKYLEEIEMQYKGNFSNFFSEYHDGNQSGIVRRVRWDYMVGGQKKSVS